jgi:hypothetical protein
MTIDESDEQFENVEVLRHESLEPDSKMILDRDLHPEKHSSSIFSTEEGIEMKESDEQFSNAKTPINKSLEPDSKVISDKD